MRGIGWEDEVRFWVSKGLNRSVDEAGVGAWEERVCNLGSYRGTDIC